MSKYNFELDIYNRNSLSIIIEMINDGSKILEFGPAHGRLTKYLKEKKNCLIDIIEIDEESGREASNYANKALIGNDEGNIENYKWKNILKDEKYDYIIFADVLEHLYYPEKVLRNSKLFLKKDGAILISIPNIAHNSVIVGLIKDRFKYNSVGILDDTHIRFFTYTSLKEMIHNCELVTTIETSVNKMLNETEIISDYSELNSPNLISELMSRDKGNVYQFIFKLQNKEYFIEQNPLVSINIDGRFYNESVLYFKDSKNLSYCEEKTKRIKVQSGRNIIDADLLNFDNASFIRFDPFTDYCFVKLNSVVLKNDFIEKNAVIISSNAYKNIDNYYLFDTKDPQIELSLDGEFDSIKIDFEIYTIYTKELIDIFFLFGEESILLKEENKRQNEENILLREENKRRSEENILLREENKKQSEENILLREENKKQSEENIEKQQHIKNIENLLNEIYNSKVWKLFSRFKGLFGK